jgi:leucyl-tRNA synthetase
MSYNHLEAEPFWQSLWEENQIYQANEDPGKPKKYVLDMFPYPSASGLHVGHPLGYVATDIYARYFRMKGYAVLHPMGWDAFGLPAEQHAIDTGEHPAKLTYRNIGNFRTTLKKLGLSIDWSRELTTCDPQYYKWTQWIFTKLYERGLAYQAEVLVNWCPALKTVLANEEVIDGRSERGDHPVHRVPMRQWMLRITSYAERLLADLDGLDWPESVKEIQRNWIGKSEGARIRFGVVGNQEPNEHIEVFTTRPDTIFGATYMVLSPEHPLIEKVTAASHSQAVRAYRDQASKKSDMERTELAKTKTGVDTGGWAINPATGHKIPIWTGDYVLAGYGTGAIMGVPGHDERDHAFARQYGLPIIAVLADPNTPGHDIQTQALTSKTGHMINSDFLDGLSVPDASRAITKWLTEKGYGEGCTNYKLRDWLFSRQRYWGEPIPILKRSDGSIISALGLEELPLTLPAVQSYEPTGDGRSPLANITQWVERKDSHGNTTYVETDTMPGSAGSSWYFLRYTDPHNENEAFSKERAKYWMPVDLYVGGQEHAVGHLLYARFWTKVLYDIGVSPVTEPFGKLINQGMILLSGAKMSKSKKNVVNPDDVVAAVGADALRVYEMFMGPLTQSKEWDDSNLGGISRFLGRINRAFTDENGISLLTSDKPGEADLKMLHKTIKKVSEDIETLSFNTAVSQMMIFINQIYDSGCRSREVMEPFLKLLSPFAPHLAEELWMRCVSLPHGNKPANAGYPFVTVASWPEFDIALTVDNEITLGVQINGKHRGEVTLARDADQDTAIKLGSAVPSVEAVLKGLDIKKVIYVPGRILNFVGGPK